MVFVDAETSNKIVTGKLLENFLYGDNHLTPEEMQALYVNFKNRHPHLKPKTEEFKEAIINDDYFNCILLKYGYAVTCHKAQGGEWENVFTVWDNDTKAGFNCFTDAQRKEGKANAAFYRWAYTAVTRASRTLFAVNPPYFNSYSTLAIFHNDMVKCVEDLTGSPMLPEEIVPDAELLAELSSFQILAEPLGIQDHFIKVRTSLRKKYIDIIGWQKKGYDIWYLCKREGATAGLRTSFNSKFVFNNKYLKLSAHTNSETLFEEAQKALSALPDIVVRRHTPETILTQIEFDLDLEERHPFLKTLYDDLQMLFATSPISIEDVRHQQYRERYFFNRGTERAVLDFVYRGDGFF
ncbi:MAG: hypothetical protein EOO01_40530, partial [Chitinophagaceae bacterium]